MKLPLQKMKLRWSSKLIHSNLWSQNKEAWKWKEGSWIVMWNLIKFLVVLAVVVRNPSFDDHKLQITTAEVAALLSSSCSPSDASQTRQQVPSTNHNYKSQITTLQVFNYKLQITKELTKSWIQMAMKASSSKKLLKRRKMRKTQKKPTKLTSINKKLRRGKECP